MIKKQLIKYIYIDIVGFTRPERSIEHQAIIFRELNEIIVQAIRQIPFSKRILLPTGDGVCLALMDWAGQPYDLDLKLAAEILRLLGEYNAKAEDPLARFHIRVGLNEDEDDIVVDINGHVNFAGRGINYARRIMDLADANQILVGANAYNRLRHNPEYRFKKYKCRIKHEEVLVVHQCIRMSRTDEGDWLNTGDIEFHKTIKRPSYEKEYKFLIPGGDNDAYLTFASIKEQIGALPLDFCLSEAGEESFTDTYFDDADLTLHRVGASFRIRENKGRMTAAIRRRLPRAGGHIQDRRYERIEEQAPLTPRQKEELKAGGPITVLPYRILPYVAPECGRLLPWLTVKSQIKPLNLSNEQNHVAELCLNAARYAIGEKQYGPFYEIELENRGAPEGAVDRLAETLEEHIGLIPSGQSRYERGISLIRTSETPNRRKKVIIDTDCGVDDALALILALSAPELAVLAITTVSGQVHVDKVTANVFKVLNALSPSDIPMVSRGAEAPLVKELRTAEYIHGEDGLGDVIPMPSHPSISSKSGWETICALARRYPQEITLITIGPMTNLALAIQNDPQGVHCLKEVVSMGGVFFEFGNVGPGTEYNVNADPEAVGEAVRFCRDSCLKIPVDGRGNPLSLPANPSRADYERIAGYKYPEPRDPRSVPLTFIGLDVAHKVLFRRSILERLSRTHPHNHVLSFIRRISAKYLDYCYLNEWLPGCYLYDPLAVGYVINPSFLTIEAHVVHVETRGKAAAGMLIPDDRPTRNPAWRDPAQEVIGIARHVEREAFEEFFINRILQAG